MKNQKAIGALYLAYLRAGNQLSEALLKRLRGGYLPAGDIAELAESHAIHYDCFVSQASNGGYRFFTSEEAVSSNRHEAAQKQWNRTIAKYHKVAQDGRGGAKKQKVDAVAKLLKAFKELSRAEQKRFLASV